MKNDTSEMEKEWDDVWNRKGLLSGIVTAARKFYTIFFERMLKKYTDSHTRMIELGCGTASIGCVLADKIAFYHGVDVSPVVVRAAKRSKMAMSGRGKVDFTIGDCRRLDMSLKNAFDLSWSHGLIEHFDDSYPVVKSHVDAVVVGGTVLISVPYKYSIHNLWYKITRLPGLKRLWPWTEQKFFSRKELADLGKRSGMPHRVFFLPPSLSGFLLGLIILQINKVE